MPAPVDSRMKGFKNRGKDMDEFRRKRSDVSVELRKARKDEQILKKRNVSSMSMISPLKENNHQVPTPLLQLDEITRILTCLDPSETDLLNAVQSTRRLLSREKNPPIDKVIKAGLVPRLVELLKYEKNTSIQFEAEWAVTNIASGSSEQTKTIVEEGAVDYFVALLRSENIQLCEQAVWALGNIAGDGPNFRDYVLSRGVVTPLLALIKQNTPHSFLRNVTWTLSNLCRNKNPPPNIQAIEPALPALASLINHPDEEIVSDACWALSYLTDGPNEKISVIIQTGVVPRLVQLLAHQNVTVVTPALRAIGNIVTGNDVQTQIVIDHNALQPLKGLFVHPKSQIVKEATWAISNIAAGNQDQIQALIDAELIEPVVNALDKGEFKVQKEAVWVVTNFTSGGSINQIVKLVNANVLPPLCNMLTTHDAAVTKVALDAVNNLLSNAQKMEAVDRLTLMIEECDGLTPLEQLQTHENESVRKAAYDIIDTYFEAESDEEQQMLEPTQSDTAYTFGAAGTGSTQFNL